MYFSSFSFSFPFFVRAGHLQIQRIRLHAAGGGGGGGGSFRSTQTMPFKTDG